MNSWWKESVVYHIYPLGFCGAPEVNPAPGRHPTPTAYPAAGDGAASGGEAASGAGAASGDHVASSPEAASGNGAAAPRVAAQNASQGAGAAQKTAAGGTPPGNTPVSTAPFHEIITRLDEIRDMGFNALYLGPVFESTSHGYDTACYSRLDRRLGSNNDLRELVEAAHARDIRVLLDGVFNHVGRDFWAFRDVQQNRENSAYVNWFRDLNFNGDNRFGDGFQYHGWEGADELVSLNLDEPAVVQHLLKVATNAVREFNVDGFRLDVAYLLPLSFLRALRDRVSAIKSDAVLVGEVIHGDYQSFVAEGPLDSITNYQMYKALWSAHNDANYFELAHAVERQSDESASANQDAGRHGSSQQLSLPSASDLYTFVDNHDVDRIASILTDPGHLFPVHTLLFTLPGVPSIYYGSEWGQPGRKAEGDRALRPPIWDVAGSNPALQDFIRQLIRVRRTTPALQYGTYHTVLLTNRQYGFVRSADNQQVLVLVNLESEPVRVANISDIFLTAGRCLFSWSAVDLANETTEDMGIAIPAYGSRIVELLW